MRTFLGGLVVGAAATACVFLALGEDRDPRSGRTVPERPVEAALRAEVETLRARLAETPPAPPAPPDAAPAETADPMQEDPKEVARREVLALVREQLQEVRDAEPESLRVRGLLQVWRAPALGGDHADVAARALMRLAAWGKLLPEDVDALADDFGRLPPGAPGRPGLAAAVARGWARDTRLAGWFDGLPPHDEPAIRAAVVEALDESPSDAYREYLLRVSRGERDPEVLNEAWQEDPITVALTPEWAPRLIAAVEPRAAQGDLPAVVRGRAFFAIGLAGLHDPAGARAALGRLLANEADEAVHAFGTAVVEAVDRGEANVQVLDGLWSRHRRAFGE